MAVARTQAQTILAEPAAEPAFLETEELDSLSGAASRPWTGVPQEKVVVESFVRAESDVALAKVLQRTDPPLAWNTFVHYRAPTPIDAQNIVRMNRDTLYSMTVIDLSPDGCTPEGVTLSFGNASKSNDRYVSAMLVSQDHDIVWTEYANENDEIDIGPSDLPTAKGLLLIRTFTDGTDDDIKDVNTLQDSYSVTPKGDQDLSNCAASAEKYVTYEAGGWDAESLGEVRDLLKKLQALSNATSQVMFAEDHTDLNPLYWMFGAASGWGGLTEEAAVYVFGPPIGFDTSAEAAYTLTIPKDIPLERDGDNFVGFWSVSMYDAPGFFVENDLDAYSYNSATATPEENGDWVITMAPEAMCEGVINCLPTPGAGWNYVVRLYVPEDEIIDGEYKLPDPVPLQ